MKLALLTSSCVLLLHLCSLTDAAYNEDAELLSILSNPKYKQNPLGNVIPGRFIIEFDDTYQGSSKDFVSSVQSDISRMGSTISSRIKMNIAQDLNASPSIFRGVSVSLYDNYVSSLAKRDTQKADMQYIENAVLKKLLRENHVKHVYPVIEIPRPKVDLVASRNAYITATNNSHEPPKLDIPRNGPQLPFTHVMTQVDQVHSKLGLKGKGIVVGIIDSGVDYYHPALGGGFGNGHLVRYGYDLVGNDFDPRDPSTRTTHDTPLDNCLEGSGHGTHVAGIVAANDKRFNFTGVAPEATLGMWRVFSCTGSTSNDVVIQALLDAHKAGCDIINLSLGSPGNWPDDPTSLVASKIAEQGSIVVVAAGNEGEYGAFYISSPSTGSKTVSVASVDNVYTLQLSVSTESGKQYPYTLSSTTKKFPSGKLVNYFNSAKKFDACNGTKPESNIKGKLVLVQRGDCTFDEKAATAKRYGAKGIVVYDNVKRDTFTPLTLRPPIPVCAVSLETGLELKQQLLSSSNHTDGIQLTFHDALTPQNVTTRYEISEFSSVGPVYDMSLKPDLAGPGGFIFSTLPLNQGGYGLQSGTSMAAPYIAGAYALYLEKHGKNHTVDFLKEHFQNYAKPRTLVNTFIDNPVRQGAGLLQLLDAINQPIHVSPGSISFNDTVNMKPQSVKITNPSSETVKYNINHLDAITAAPYDLKLQGFAPLAPLHYMPNASVANLSFSITEITLSPGETAEVTINVSSISDSNENNPYPMYGGFVQFLPDNQTLKPIHVPYIGVKGSLAQLPIFGEKFPFLLSLNSSRDVTLEDASTNFTNGITIDRSNNATSFVTSIFRLVTGTSQLVTEVLDENQTSIGVFSEYESLPRNLLIEYDYFFSENWNGTVLADRNDTFGELLELEPGYYHLNWKALKLLSDPNVPESWETKISPPILIKDDQF